MKLRELTDVPALFDDAEPLAEPSHAYRLTLVTAAAASTPGDRQGSKTYEQ